MKYILVIAGSDSSGGAGIQADIKTITSLGAHALTAVTAITAQNSQGISAIHKVPARFVSKQVETIIEDLYPDAVKIGMLYSKAVVMEVAKALKKFRLRHVVLDPVFKASTGRSLLEPGALNLLNELLFPFTDVITPNLFEAGIIAGKKVVDLEDMSDAAKQIKLLGPDVVITGGHLEKRCVDILYDGRQFYHFYGSKIEIKHTHGSGCVFSTALTTYLSMGNDITTAVELAHDFARCAVTHGYACGEGAGPVQAGKPGTCEQLQKV
ncbi:MAG: bifunctional hydroxymethylpyrimidine kinase/phosphomethylpyrimidine kinase [Deltaproteobacteria bacterium]|nr:bifunctional hydroxymethylpyrimidine kinase/phosphomethylpyrimidine kinase [Deltaproteobacteria bacterium]